MNDTKPKRLDARRLAAKFANPYYDSSDQRMWLEELKIIRRMIRANFNGYNHADHLTQERVWVKEIDGHAIYWQWSISSRPYYERQYDAPVERLVARGIIRSVRCAGGYTYMTFTDSARNVLGLDL